MIFFIFVENLEILIIGITSVSIALLKVITNIRQRLEALPAIHPLPLPPPPPVQNGQPDAQPQPPRRSTRPRRGVNRLNL